MTRQQTLVAYQPSRTDYNPVTPEATQDPFTQWDEVSEGPPVFYAPNLDCWVVSRYDEIKAVLEDPQRYGGFSIPLTIHKEMPPEIAAIAPDGLTDPVWDDDDPRVHRRAKALLRDVFKPRANAGREVQIRQVVDDLIDQFADLGEVEIVSALLAPLPVHVFANIMNFPAAARQRISDGSDTNMALRTSEVTPEREMQAWRDAIDYHLFLQKLITDRRASPLEDDLLTEFMQARDDAGDEPAFTDRELVALVRGLNDAGQQAVRVLVGNMLVRLLEDPARLEAVRQDPALIGAAVEETARHSGPVKALWRTTKEDVEIGGVAIPKGQMLHLLSGHAARDDERFDHADQFDLYRHRGSGHFGFGRGIHFCIGAPLARMEAEVALERILTRLPGLRFPEGASLERIPSIMTFKLARLDVEWDVVQ